MLANDVHHLLNLVEGGHDKIDADDVVPSLSDFTTKLTFGGVVEDHRRRLDVFRDIIESPATNNLTIAEDALAAGHLSMEQLGPDGIPFAFPAEGTTNGSQEHIRHVDDPVVIFDGSPSKLAMAVTSSSRT
jgi:hypothetical protein